MEFRKVFDAIPEQFDRYRPRYSPALFSDLITYAEIGPGKTVLELGPGTGQATEPILDTGCDYHAIELGEHLVQFMNRKYGSRPNFHIVIPEPDKSRLFSGLREAVLEAGDRIVFQDAYVLYLAKKPLNN